MFNLPMGDSNIFYSFHHKNYFYFHKFAMDNKLAHHYCWEHSETSQKSPLSWSLPDVLYSTFLRFRFSHECAHQKAEHLCKKDSSSPPIHSTGSHCSIHEPCTSAQILYKIQKHPYFHLLSINKPGSQDGDTADYNSNQSHHFLLPLFSFILSLMAFLCSGV